MHRTITAVVAISAVAAGLSLSLPNAESAAPASPIGDLAGRWAGDGTVQWRTGREEPYRCIVTNFLDEGAKSIKQTLRCHNAAENRLEVASHLRVAGEAISGTWEERLSSMNGTIKGRVTANGYEAFAENPFFTAAFAIEMSSACEQQVTIRPSREIAVIKANLKKC